MTRRDFLAKSLRSATAVYAAGAAGILFPDEAFALSEGNGFWRRNRLLEMRRADTGEQGKILFYETKQGYIKNGYLAARWFLRDAKDNNAVINIDTGLLNLLYGLQEWARIAGKPNPLITVNSAYRTPRRNASIEGASRNSLHIQGRAVDITMHGIGLKQLADMAAHFNAGGIGLYGSFVHLDTGRIRNWRGR